ncbi:MAG TPA: helix-turn-helix domain-containing protein [Candidatus Baltobacteraceae bacterium]|nr:helix-turn-helix domain-containing protein [Candidatus Baltobacteraceae bacterium]
MRTNRSRRLGELLRSRRLSIHPQALDFGSYTRLPARVGHRVTQEEAAEALGVSREWYSVLENGGIPRLSSRLAHRVAEVFGLGGIARAGAFAREDLEAQVTGSLIELQRFARDLGSSSSFAESAGGAVEALRRIARPDCGAIYSLVDADGRTSGYAAGPRAPRHWSDLSNEVMLEAHQASLQTGGAGIIERVLLPDEAEAEARVVSSFTQPDGQTRYEFECSLDRWRSFNGGLKVRSALIVPLFERGAFSGVLACGWLEPRSIAAGEVEVARLLSTLVDLASACA